MLTMLQPSILQLSSAYKHYFSLGCLTFLVLLPSAFGQQIFKYNTVCCCYADDIQLYVSKKSTPTTVLSPLTNSGCQQTFFTVTAVSPALMSMTLCPSPFLSSHFPKKAFLYGNFKLHSNAVDQTCLQYQV